AFLFAAILWPAVREGAAELERGGMPPVPALTSAQSQVVSRQVQRVSIPKRFSIPMREIWQLQPRFHKRRGRSPERLMSSPRFRAAYDFLLLRAAVGETDPALAKWWGLKQQGAEVSAPAPKNGSSRRRRRGGRRRNRHTASTESTP